MGRASGKEPVCDSYPVEAESRGVAEAGRCKAHPCAHSGRLRHGQSASWPGPTERWIKKRLKNSGARIAPEFGLPGTIRLRRSLAGEDSWRVELFGSACHLDEFAA